jgi:hypothetical protein
MSIHFEFFKKPQMPLLSRKPNSKFLRIMCGIYKKSAASYIGAEITSQEIKTRKKLLLSTDR